MQFPSPGSSEVTNCSVGISAFLGACKHGEGSCPSQHSPLLSTAKPLTLYSWIEQWCHAKLSSPNRAQLLKTLNIEKMKIL